MQIKMRQNYFTIYEHLLIQQDKYSDFQMFAKLFFGNHYNTFLKNIEVFVVRSNASNTN